MGRTAFGKLMPRVAYPVVRGPLRGTKFMLGTLEGEGGGASVYFNMVEPEQTAAFVETLKPADVFFDVGANVGYYTVLGAKAVGARGRVVAFEPLVRNLNYLYRHVQMNRLENVKIIPSACSDTISLAAFSSGQNTAMGHLAETIGSCAETLENDIALVSTVTLDAVAARLHVTPNVLKIDVEGAELAVLRGASERVLPARPRIFLSVHSKTLRADCLKLLRDFDYEFEPLGDAENTMEFLAK